MSTAIAIVGSRYGTAEVSQEMLDKSVAEMLADHCSVITGCASRVDEMVRQAMSKAYGGYRRLKVGDDLVAGSHAFVVQADAPRGARELVARTRHVAALADVVVALPGPDGLFGRGTMIAVRAAKTALAVGLDRIDEVFYHLPVARLGSGGAGIPAERLA